MVPASSTAAIQIGCRPMPEITHSGRVALSLVVLGVILLLLSVSGFPSAGWNPVLRSTAIALLIGGIAYFLFLRRDRLHEWQSLIGSVIGVVVTIAVAIWVTSALTTAMKGTDFFLDFTKRYHAIRTDAHDLDTKVKKEPTSVDQSDAYQIYFQLFGLMYDEMYAYQNNFLDKEVLVEWLSWQMYDYTGGQFTIAEVSYNSGWQSWLATPAKYHQYTPIMKTIFACKDKECVRGAIDSVKSCETFFTWLGLCRVFHQPAVAGASSVIP